MASRRIFNLNHWVVALFILGSAKVLAYGVEDAVLDGLALDPRVQSALAEYNAAQEEVDMARGGYYPSANAEAGFGNFEGETEYLLNVRQMLFDWGRVASEVSVREADSLVAREDWKINRSEVALEATLTYLNFYQAQKSTEIYNEYVEGLEQLILRAESRVAGRYSDRAEVDRARVEKSRAIEVLAIQRGMAQSARGDFLALFGRDTSALSLQAPPSLPIVDQLIGAVALDAGVTGSPRVQAAQAEVEKARAQVRLSKAQLLPQVNLEADWVRREFNGSVDTDTIVALRLRSDTFIGTSNFRRPKAIKNRLRSKRYQLEATQRDLRRTLEQFAVLQPTLQDRVVALKEQAQGAREIITTYEQQFLAGLRDFEELLSITRDHFEARRQQNELEIEIRRQQYKVAADFGLLASSLLSQGDYATVKDKL